jgi:hypothetical protein
MISNLLMCDNHQRNKCFPRNTRSLKDVITHSTYVQTLVLITITDSKHIFYN